MSEYVQKYFIDTYDCSSLATDNYEMLMKNVCVCKYEMKDGVRIEC